MKKAVAVRSEILITRMSAAYREAWEALLNKDFDKAKEAYMHLHKCTQEMGHADKLDRDMAAFCANEIYTELKDRAESAPVSKQFFTTMMVASFAVLLFGAILYATPSISGLSVFDFGTPVWTGEEEYVADGATSLDVSELFELGLLGQLGVMATGSRVVDIIVDGTEVTFTPHEGFHGKTKITLIGFDMNQNPPAFIKVPLTIFVP